MHGGLPHLWRQRSSRRVAELLKVAEESINTSFGFGKRGINTFGDRNAVGERKIDSRRFGSFFEGQLGRLTALLESMERQMPSQLKEARIAVECLLGAPFVSSLSCFENWEERDWRSGLVPKIGFDAGG